MKCITSPALDDVQILSFVEGEADDSVVAHIKECPYCSQKAGQWTRMQKHLRKQFYRVMCPTPMELGNYHLGYLPDTQKLVVAQHLRECALCKREVAELEEFMLEPIPQTDLLKPIKVLIALLLGGKKTHEDFASTPVFAGLRGEGEEPLIYQADNIRIVIEVQEDVEQMGFKTLLGLVTGLESDQFTIQLSQENQVIATTSVDEIGNFFIAHLSPGHYKLILTGSNMEIHVQSLPV
jgi:hypothetical protein